jgi:hypothetical protein
MEYRRTTATDQQLSILVIGFQFPASASSPAAKGPVLGDAAKAIARKLRDQDSIYILGNACFGVILPGLEVTAARSLASRVGEGLIEVAGLNARFTYKIDVINYPQNAESAHQLYQAVAVLIPPDPSLQGLPAEAYA